MYVFPKPSIELGLTCSTIDVIRKERRFLECKMSKGKIFFGSYSVNNINPVVVKPYVNSREWIMLRIPLTFYFISLGSVD